MKFAIFLLVTFFAVLGAGVVSFGKVTHTQPWSRSFYEEEPPVIAWVTEPPGIGSDLITAKVKVTDSGGGLDEVLVRISQRNQPQELVKRNFGVDSISQETIEFPIDAKTLNLREGKAELEVIAFDRTMWSNAAHVVLPLTVDFSKPRIEVITPQQNGVEGGTELVFFKVIGKKPVLQGVEYRGIIYPAYKAKLWDDSFKNYDELYVAFFPIPIGFSDEAPRMRVIGRDDIGNAASAPFNYLVRHRRFPSAKSEIDAAASARILESLTAFATHASLRLPLGRGAATDLPTLLKALRLQDEAILSDVFAHEESRRWWRAPFARPVTTLPTYSMGDQRSYLLDGVEVWRDVLGGARFGVTHRSNVQAVNAGRVVFAGELGLLGTTVVIDHGFGLTSLYAHLSESSTKVGEEVTTSQVIGRTGTSGFALSEELYFEVRVHGVPVSPNEWWDATWLADHIDKKVAFVQGALIGNPGE